MQRTISSVGAISAEDIYRFIKLYKGFESLTLKNGYALIKDALSTYPGHDWQISHLCDQWRYKERHFGEFWLNLDSRVQMCFLKFWEFTVEGADPYIKTLEDDPKAAMFVKAPALVRGLNNVVMFFENHGIDEQIDEIDLPALPHEEKRYGNATNWGEYILSIRPMLTNEVRQVLEAIHDYYPKRRLTNQ